MDSNNHGRIEKQECVAYMSADFDKAAGAKGYCAYEEVKRSVWGSYNAEYPKY